MMYDEIEAEDIWDEAISLIYRGRAHVIAILLEKWDESTKKEQRAIYKKLLHQLPMGPLK